MVFPIVSILVALILIALIWWVIDQLVTDEFIRKIARVVMVVLCVLFIVGLITGTGPSISFR